MDWNVSEFDIDFSSFGNADAQQQREIPIYELQCEGFDPLHPNKVLQCIAAQYSEFNQRFFMDISMNSAWIDILAEPNINSSTSNVCLHMLDDMGGFGNRLFRDPVAFFLAYMHQCTFADHWGYCQNHTNFFGDLFVDSYELIACKYPTTEHSLNRNIKATYILDNISIDNGYKLLPIHGEIQKILPYTTILVHYAENASDGYEYDQNTIWTHYPLPEKDILFDADIDEHYAELRPWNAYLKWFPVLRYYGLLVQQLRYKHRMEIVQFLQRYFKDKFVITLHLRTGRGEVAFNRYVPSDLDIMYQIENVLTRVFAHADISRYGDIRRFGFFVASDFKGSVDIIRRLVKEKWNQMTMHANISHDVNIDGMDIDWNEIVFTKTNVKWTNQSESTFGKGEQENDCVDDAKNVYVDSELLGYGDVLLLPYVSTFTRLSRALVMKRKKIICHSVVNARKHEQSWFCKDFKRNFEWKYKIDCCDK